MRAGCWVLRAGHAVCYDPGMLKALASYGLAKLLGFGIVGAIVIYFLLSMAGY